MFYTTSYLPFSFCVICQSVSEQSESFCIPKKISHILEKYECKLMTVMRIDWKGNILQVKQNIKMSK